MHGLYVGPACVSDFAVTCGLSRAVAWLERPLAVCLSQCVRIQGSPNILRGTFAQVSFGLFVFPRGDPFQGCLNGNHRTTQGAFYTPHNKVAHSQNTSVDPEGSSSAVFPMFVLNAALSMGVFTCPDLVVVCF